MKAAVIIVAAGLGTRLGADRPKALVELGGRSLLSWATERAALTHGVSCIVVVGPEDYCTEAEQAANEGILARMRSASSSERDQAGGPLSLVVVPGGAERSDSVANGLAAVDANEPDVDCILVHDAARCLAPVELFDAVVAAIAAGDVAVVPGLAVPDTIKRVDADGIVIDTPPRAALRAVQTPQGFAPEVLRRAHAGNSGNVTDDAALVERLGLPVRVIDGHWEAEKVTTQIDLERIRRYLDVGL